MSRRNDWRARNHPAWWAFLVQRLSGLGLALFLPLHFWVLGRAIEGESALQGFIAVTDRPLFKVGEWGLVVLLALHMIGGLRLLAIEFRPWTGLRNGWVAGTLGFGAAAGLAFVLALIL